MDFNIFKNKLACLIILLFLTTACNNKLYLKKNVEPNEVVKNCSLLKCDNSVCENRINNSLYDLISLYESTNHDNEEEKETLNNKFYDFCKLNYDTNLKIILGQLCSLSKKDQIKLELYNRIRYNIYKYYYYDKFKRANTLKDNKLIYNEIDSQKKNYEIIPEIHHNICSNLLSKVAHEIIESNMLSDSNEKQQQQKGIILFLLETALHEYHTYDGIFRERIDKESDKTGLDMKWRYGYLQGYLQRALYDLGRVHIFYGEYEKSLKYLQEMHEIMDYWYNYYNQCSLDDEKLSYLVYVYLKLDKYKEAKKLAEEIYSTTQRCEFIYCCGRGVACPWIYVYNGNKYEKRVEILQNIVGKENEQNQIVLLGKVFVKDNLVKIQIREEKYEISHINQIALIINGQKVYSDNTLLSKVDDKYLVLKKGDICNLTFVIPAYLNKFMDNEILIEANGFYVKEKLVLNLEL